MELADILQTIEIDDCYEILNWTFWGLNSRGNELQRPAVDLSRSSEGITTSKQWCSDGSKERRRWKIGLTHDVPCRTVFTSPINKTSLCIQISSIFLQKITIHLDRL